MSDKIATLIVEIDGRETSLADKLRKTKAGLKETADEAKRSGQAIGALGGQASKADRDILALASAQASLARSAGDGAGAERILAQAISQVDQNSIQAIRTQTTLNQIKKQNGDAAGGLTGRLDALKSGMSGVTAAAGAMGIAFGVQQVVQFGAEITQLGLQASRTRTAFDGLASAGGQSGSKLMAALRGAAHGEISDLNLQLAANRANLLGVAKSAEDLSSLLEIARDRAIKMGTDTTSAFNDIVTGLGRSSPMILDNLGITVKLGEANEQYAAKLGKSAAALTETEKKQALINYVLEQGRASLAATGQAADDNASKVAKLAASWENLKARMGEKTAAVLAPAAEGANQVLSIPEQTEAAAQKAFAGAKSFEEYGQRVNFVNGQLAGLRLQLAAVNPILAAQAAPMQSLTQAQFNYAQSLMQQGVAATDAIAKAQEMNNSLIMIGAVQQRVTNESTLGAAALDTLSNSMLRTAATGAEGAAFVQGLTQAFLSGRISATDMQAALDQVAASHQLAAQAAADNAREENVHAMAAQMGKDAVLELAKSLSQQAVEGLKATGQSQDLAIVQAALAKIAQNAANGLISDANAASIMAQYYGVATNEAYALINAQRQLAGLQAQSQKAISAASPAYSGNKHAAGIRRQDEREEAAAARQAEAQRRAVIDRDLAYQKASNAEKLKMTQRELQKTKAYSDEWVRLKKQEANLQDSLDKKATKGGGGAGGRAGAVKLSDQQKLNNALLTDQEKANDKFEDEEAKHFDKLLDIEKEFAKKSLEAQKANEVSKRRSRFDFYNALTSAEKDIGGGVGSDLAKQYEEAFATSQQMASEGKQKQASEYLKMRQEQIQADLDYYKALKQAQADNDAGEVDRLNQMRELRKQAEAEELKQLQEGGDANVNDRAAKIDDENKRYEEQTGKIADSAERAAERRVLAAQRAGKEVDAEIVKVQRLGQAYQQVGFNPTGAAPSPGADSSTAIAPATAGQLVAVIDQAVINAVNAASAAQLAKLDGVIAAIGTLTTATTDVGDRVDRVAAAVRDIRLDGSGIR